MLTKLFNIYFILLFTGNILIFFAILTKKELKTSANMILACISVADGLSTVLVIFFSVGMDIWLNYMTPPHPLGSNCLNRPSIPQYLSL